MDISITIPTELEARVTSAVCAGAGLEESPENVKQALLNHIMATVNNVEQSRARQALRENDTANQIVLT